jgi:hypothetical protein
LCAAIPLRAQARRERSAHAIRCCPGQSALFHKQWDRDAFATDLWGRYLYGTPPRGRADYAFWQHILCSLAPETRRYAILFRHGVLFRQKESDMRRKLIEADVIECVLGLGPKLFYNSPMEACVVIYRTAKPKAASPLARRATSSYTNRPKNTTAGGLRAAWLSAAGTTSAVSRWRVSFAPIPTCPSRGAVHT